jgi:vacuolar protein sorting-associated protein 54
VGVMIALIPKLKECIAHHMSKQASSFSEFDRVVKDYKNHQGEIHAKLVAIMNERFAAHVKAMQLIQWDEDEPQSGKNANTYMETLVTETVRLHKVLAKYLPIHDLKVRYKCLYHFITNLVILLISLLCHKYSSLLHHNFRKKLVVHLSKLKRVRIDWQEMLHILLVD